MGRRRCSRLSTRLLSRWEEGDSTIMLRTGSSDTPRLGIGRYPTSRRWLRIMPGFLRYISKRFRSRETRRLRRELKVFYDTFNRNLQTWKREDFTGAKMLTRNTTS